MWEAGQAGSDINPGKMVKYNISDIFFFSRPTLVGITALNMRSDINFSSLHHETPPDHLNAGRQRRMFATRR